MSEQELIRPIFDDAFDVVAIASSAGGVTALSELLAELPSSFPSTILVVQHLSPNYISHLAEILARKTQLPVKPAENGEQARPSTIYIAPPNQHLLIAPDRTLSLTQTELVHFLRPSADILFKSIAAAYGKRAIAVVLTGTGKDGAMGVKAIHQTGGTVIVQDPETAEFNAMPKNAIATGSVDFILPLPEIAEKLIVLVTP
ncbi:MAG: chemotaxis protein CheB [Snowella sp.]|nr:MAG: chemotaxis protein CheB [Snowella sp.]